jgi:DDE superfamily endonuclease
MSSDCQASTSNPAAADPRSFPPEIVVAVKAIACELPSRLGMPLSRLHVPDIRDAIIARGLVADISGLTIWRWLDADAIKPWTHRSWIFPRAPDFEEKAGRALDLYERRFMGKRLRPDEYVISADEKTSIQARIRVHQTTPPGPGRSMRVEHEYERGGSLAYLAAMDVHRAKFFGVTAPTTGIVAFDELVAQVMKRKPYRDARRVFWIVDNGSSHRGDTSIKRLEGRYPNLTLVHLPIHASWLNQIEIYFSIIQRKVLTPSDFSDGLPEVARRLIAFQKTYEKIAEPFEWKFTRNDLARLMRKLEDQAAA